MNDLLSRYPELEKCKGSIAEALELLLAVYQNHGKVLVCGNGGSAADSEHIVGELMKGFLLPRQVTDERISMELREKIQGALPAISLCSQEGFLTAFSNDSDPDLVFAQQVYAYGKKEDLVIGISTSGNSKNRDRNGNKNAESDGGKWRTCRRIFDGVYQSTGKGNLSDPGISFTDLSLFVRENRRNFFWKTIRSARISMICGLLL